MTDFEEWLTVTLQQRWIATLKKAHWVNRVYGSWTEYERSRPLRVWERTDSGWSSVARITERWDNWAAV